MLEKVEILQVAEADCSPVCLRAVDIVGQIARQLGANVFTSEGFSTGEDFYGRGKQEIKCDADTWLKESDNRYVLYAATGEASNIHQFDSRAVVLKLPALASEATLFAECGLADLLGDPMREALIPRGDFAAGTIAYGVYCSLAAVLAKERRCNASDVAVVDGIDVMSWVNWKAALVAENGAELGRQGSDAEWPVMACKDGFFALVYQERDWNSLCRMIGDDRLLDDRFSSFKGRQKHRDEYMTYIQEWSVTKSKKELINLFLEYEIPAAPVMNVQDMLQDDLLQHRDAFDEVQRCGRVVKTPKLPHRIAATSDNGQGSTKSKDSGLPLADIRVLDLGIITAGAGVSALLADMGAEVLKIESHTYPDPFRQWAGEAVSPFFKGNNRNKYGVAIDLKTPEGKAAFLKLVESADVIVENFRRGVLDRLGLSYEVLKEVNPNILLASISGQGLTGPGTDASSFGSTLEASSGFATSVSYEDGVPYITGRNVNFPDQIVVLYAAAMITTVLSSGQTGMQLDVSQRDVAMFLSGELIEQQSSGESALENSGGIVCKTGEGDWLAFEPGDEPAADNETWQAWVAARNTAEAISQFAEKQIGAAIINRGSDMLACMQAKQSQAFLRSPGGALVKGFPFQLLETPMSIRLESPEVGEHTARFVS